MRRKENKVKTLNMEEWAQMQEEKQRDKNRIKKTHTQELNETGVHELGNGECYFCGEYIKTQLKPFYMDTEYMKHLHTHGFKLLMPKCITDVFGLMKYITEKISNCMCVCCNKKFSSISRLRSHMVSLFHTRYVNSEEYDDYYSYPDTPNAYILEGGAELLLPSGRIAGHKKYAKYYAQTLRDESYYKSLNPMGERFAEQRMLQKQEIEQTQEEIIKIEKYVMHQRRNEYKVSKSANKQKHYREDWMQ